jgi:hypothetical protein
MVKLEKLKGKTKDEIVDICRNDGYRCDIRKPGFLVEGNIKPLESNPMVLAGIKSTDYVRYIELKKGEDEILIVDVYNGYHNPISDENITRTLLFSSELKKGIYTVGYAWDIDIKK